jgi:hypothetical protein
MATWDLAYEFFSWWYVRYTSGFDVYLSTWDSAVVQEFVAFFHEQELPDQVYVVG